MRLSDSIFINGRRASARSFAKINLTLDILGRRDNGYHDIKMVMQTINLSDLIIVDRLRSGIHLSTNLSYLPVNNKNIAYKAAALFFKETHIHGGARIFIRKNIPVAAGLAGGSGNGAAVLCALNLLYGAELSDERLCELGAKLGADVPYCVTGGTALAEGIGEALTPLPDAPPMNVLLVKPPVSVSTAAIYESIDSARILARPDNDAMIAAIESGDYGGICSNLCNVMEAVTVRDYPVVRGIKERMISYGADGALMSGSGPTVFGLFADYSKAKKAADEFYYQFRDVYLCKTMN